QALSAPADVLVVSRDESALEQARKGGAMALRESCAGHNPALAQALLVLDRSRRAPVLIVSSDLPWLSVQDLEAMLSPGGAVRIATDLAQRGTNALYLTQPTSLPLHFGEDSRAAHQAAATQAGLDCEIVLRPGLARDIDTPQDLDILLHKA
ncbi:2-phospho-L-lactate guanylyltransferase, partial [Novosphingobium rosa]|uniref:2-phospho-L-lactate guanylyltransferase n=1 Tax=Novosphingobium rosa TaxID=76978 RepID=UPI00082CBBC1